MHTWEFVSNFLLRKFSIIYKSSPNNIINPLVPITLLQLWPTNNHSVPFILPSTFYPSCVESQHVWEYSECYVLLVKCRMHGIKTINKHDLVSKILGGKGTRKRKKLCESEHKKHGKTGMDYWWCLQKQTRMHPRGKVLIVDKGIWWVTCQGSWTYHLCLLFFPSSMFTTNVIKSFICGSILPPCLA